MVTRVPRVQKVESLNPKDRPNVTLALQNGSPLLQHYRCVALALWRENGHC